MPVSVLILCLAALLALVELGLALWEDYRAQRAFRRATDIDELNATLHDAAQRAKQRQAAKRRFKLPNGPPPGAG